MARSTPKRVRLLQRQHTVADFYVRGWPQVAIAEHLNVAQATISNDLRRVQEYWRNSAVRDFDLLKELELRKIDRIEREAWEAWQRSQQPQQEAHIQGDAPATQSRRTVRNRYGDPRFLQIVCQCSAQRRALLGLDAPAVVTAIEPSESERDAEAKRTMLLAIMTHIQKRKTDDTMEGISEALVEGSAPIGPMDCNSNWDDQA